MNEIMIAICEDSEIYGSALKSHLKKAAQELHREIQIWTFSTGQKFSERLCPIFDMVFLSLDMSDVNIEHIIERLRRRNVYMHLVLLSTTTDTASIGYRYGAKNHLVKPIKYPMIRNEIQNYIKAEFHLPKTYLWISNREGHYKIYHSQLRYIETEKRHLILHYGNQIIQYTSRICDYEKWLPENLFFRCNNSYIVNLDYISHIVPEGGRYNIYLWTDEKLPLSRSKYKELREVLYGQDEEVDFLYNSSN